MRPPIWLALMSTQGEDRRLVLREDQQERFRIAPLDMEIDLPNRNIGFWTTALARNRLEVVHFFGKLETYLSKAGLRP